MMAASPVRCRLFGMQVLTHVMPHCVHSATGPVSLEIAPVSSGDRDLTDLGSPEFAVHMRHPDGEGQYEMWRRGEILVLKIDPVAVFLCQPHRLEYQMLTTLPHEALQWQTFGLVLSAWSEWAGRPVVHAGTVEVGGTAVGFLGRSGAGKSSLTLEFLKNAHRVLGDDQLILSRGVSGVVASPAIPWLKLSLEVVERAGLDPSTLPSIHSASEKRRLDVKEGEWPSTPIPVGPMYVLERGGVMDDVIIERMGPSEALLELVRHTYVPRTVAASGMAGLRLPLLAAAVQQGGVWRLRYPNGVRWLSEVRSAVIAHQAHVSESLVRSRQ